MEFGGRWKPLHYVIRRTFAPLALSWEMDNRLNKVRLNVVSDLTQDVELDFKVELLTWSGESSTLLVGSQKV